MKKKKPLCSYCGEQTCFNGDISNAPAFCPSNTYAVLLDQTKEKLQAPGNKKMAQDVARTWKEYVKLTRVEETIEYARLQGHKKTDLE